MCGINIKLYDLHVFAIHVPSQVDRDSVGKVTRYGLSDPGEIFSTCSDQRLGLHRVT